MIDSFVNDYLNPAAIINRNGFSIHRYCIKRFDWFSTPSIFSVPPVFTKKPFRQKGLQLPVKITQDLLTPLRKATHSGFHLPAYTRWASSTRRTLRSGVGPARQILTPLCTQTAKSFLACVENIRLVQLTLSPTLLLANYQLLCWWRKSAKVQ